MQDLSTAQLIAVFALPAVCGITLHEVAHGWVARQLGDRTAEAQGRLSLNPLRHIDPIGTVAVPAALLLFGAPPFGWAKPVPVSKRNLKHPQRDMAIVAAAGPLSNLLMALLWVLAARVALGLGGDQGGGLVLPLLYAMGLAGLYVNVVLAALNMVPLLPLDGGRVLNGFLPPHISDKFERLEPLGFILVLVLLWSGALSPVLGPVIELLLIHLTDLAGVPLSELWQVLR